MARYNSIATTGTTSTAGAFVTPDQGIFTTLTGSPGYTVTLADPDRSVGQAQTFYNSTAGDIIIAAPSGVIKGPGFVQAASQTIPSNSTYTITSDGDNFILTNNEGGPAAATTVTASGTITAQAAFTMTASNANVTLSPTGTGTITISPATAGTINNMSIGATTRSTAQFTTLNTNSTYTSTGQVLITDTTAATNVNTGALQVDGGVGVNGTVHAGGFTGPLTGNVTGNVSGSSGSTTGNSATASAVNITTDNGTNATKFPLFSTSQTGNQSPSTDNGYTYNPSSGTLTAVIVTASSDARLKENVIPIANALDLVLQLEGVEFNRIGQEAKEIGVIAQKTEEVLPQVVHTADDGFKSVAYGNIVGLLIEAVKEQQLQIEELKKRMA
tara:strand:+ start:417 stop:1574 length:1158 start_codon:yes stop_codon:yes gene_type:complete